jgi:transcriptional regulator GlxA family with amidase domain
MRLSQRLGRREIERREQLIAELRAPFLPARVERVTEALREATTLVEQLKRELDARTALLAEIKDQVAATTERATDLEKLAEVDDDTTRALNRYFDGALKHRLGELEQSARRREWLLGTIGAISFGIIAILLSHYIFGF